MYIYIHIYISYINIHIYVYVLDEKDWALFHDGRW